jgi:hypothetical protein
VVHAAPNYSSGTSAALNSAPPGTFDLGTHLPSYIGSTTADGSGTALDGGRVYFFDNLNSTDDPATVTPFNLLVWQFSTPKDSVRLYTHQDHLIGTADTAFEAQDVMEYSVWGCNGVTGGCKDKVAWTLLSDVVAFADVASGNPTYTFAGTDPSFIYRGGSAEFGALNAYTRDYTFGSSYNFYGIRASSISFAASDADPELDALVAFNQRDVHGVPAPTALVSLGLLGLLLARRARTG